MVLAPDFEAGAFSKGLTRLVDPPLAAEHEPRHDQGLGPAAALGEAACDQGLIGALPFHCGGNPAPSRGLAAPAKVASGLEPP